MIHAVVFFARQLQPNSFTRENGVIIACQVCHTAVVGEECDFWCKSCKDHSPEKQFRDHVYMGSLSIYGILFRIVILPLTSGPCLLLGGEKYVKLRVKGVQNSFSGRVLHQKSQCSYQFPYGDGSGTAGFYVSDMLDFDTVTGSSIMSNSLGWSTN